MSKAGDESSGGGYDAASAAAASGGGELAGRKMVEGKSKFSVTCGRLSQYLKNNGSFGDLKLGISHSFQPQAQSVTPTRQTKPPPPIIDLSSDHSDECPSSPTSFLPDLNTTTRTQISHNRHFVSTPKNPEMDQGSQMTIFYRGRILVFDHFTIDKVNELVAIANRRSVPIAAANSVNFQQSTSQSTPNSLPDRFNCPPPQNTSPASTSGNSQIPIHNTPAVATPHMSIASDLPIARRVSLNRFLEKRKGRIVSKAPYQVNGSPDISSADILTPEKKGEEGCSGFGKPEKRPMTSVVPGEESSHGKMTIESQSPEEKKWLGLATQSSEPEIRRQ